jgi:predicted nucleic acid-binding protein
LEKYAKEAIGCVDCISFVLMRARGIERAFTFDADFRVAGFEILP